VFIDGRIITGPPCERVSPGLLGVRCYERGRCFDGYTLFSQAFGEVEYLIDMNGLVVHTWPVTHSQLAELLPTGNLMVDDYGHGISELTPRGETVWEWRGPYHHDFYCKPDGNVVLLVERWESPLDGLYLPGTEPGQSRTDGILEVDQQGNVCWEFWFGDHLAELAQQSGLPLPVPYARRDEQGRYHDLGLSDWAHANTIELLPETPLGARDARFRRGNMLFSLRALDIIGVIDPESEEIVWAWGLGELDGQHQPTMLDDGNILIFDNGTARGFSRAVEMNPATGEVVWVYEDRDGFFSPFRAGVQRLPNGNTLIAESDAGRILEVTPDKELVWDFHTPFLGQRDGHQGRHIYRATRYSEEQCAALFDARDDRTVAVADETTSSPLTFRQMLRFYQERLKPDSGP